MKLLLVKKHGPVDYDLQVWCRHCSEPRLMINCKFVHNYGWKCPECGCKCRTKPKQPHRKYIPYERSPNIRREIKQLAK